MINKIIEGLKQEKIIIVILIVTVLSCIFVHVSDFTSYIDTYTMGLWFSSLAISAGLRENGVFDKLISLVSKRITNTRTAAFILVFMTFFSAPFLTDAAALAFYAPITVSLLSGSNGMIMYILSLQTAAANLGAMIFPAASVQNLYLYRKYNLTYGRYFGMIAPLYIAAAVILLLLCLIAKKQPVEEKKPIEGKPIESPYFVVIYVTLFMLNVFAVLGIVSMLTVFASVCLAVVIMEPKIFSDVDCSRLILPVSMLVLMGNITQIRELTVYISRLFSGKLFESTILFSQLLGNVPSSVFFSVFSHSPSDMITAANIGGLGLVSASAAGMYAKRISGEGLVSDSAKFPVYCFGTGAFIGVLLYIAAKYVFPLLK